MRYYANCLVIRHYFSIFAAEFVTLYILFCCTKYECVMCNHNLNFVVVYG